MAHADDAGEDQTRPEEHPGEGRDVDDRYEDARVARPGPGRRGDVFFVVLSTAQQLHHYFVSAHGDLTYIGPSPLIEHDTAAPPPYWAGGDTDRN